MFLKITIALFLLTLESSAQPIRDYEVFAGVCTSKPERSTFIALRKFYLGNALHYLLVSPADLSTRVSSATDVRCAASSWNQIRKLYADSSYFHAMHEAEQNSDPLQDAGITHFLPGQHGVDLTIDLCPSRRPLDRSVFIELVKEFYKVESPVPIAISITGLWMQEHRDDFQWLLELVRSGQISVEWINHTFNHRTSRTLPLKENFLLEKGTNLPFEVLHTEVKMIENGIKPSIFFRFPGLVSDRQLFRAITAYGLIPVGSDAWLAKNQWPKPGSIILIHANGNEPIGIKDFLQLLKKERNHVLNKRWLLYDLRESVEEEDCESN